MLITLIDKVYNTHNVDSSTVLEIDVEEASVVSIFETRWIMQRAYFLSKEKIIVGGEKKEIEKKRGGKVRSKDGYLPCSCVNKIKKKYEKPNNLLEGHGTLVKHQIEFNALRFVSIDDIHIYVRALYLER